MSQVKVKLSKGQGQRSQVKVTGLRSNLLRELSAPSTHGRCDTWVFSCYFAADFLGSAHKVQCLLQKETFDLGGRGIQTPRPTFFNVRETLILIYLFYINYLSTDYFGTRQIIFGNNMNTIEMVPYSILVIAEYNLSGSKIICRQIFLKRLIFSRPTLAI